MSKFTKQALIESFLRIAARKPIEKITVRDVVEDCGVNRNTFYYYFSDVYGLMEEFLATETEGVLSKRCADGSPSEIFLALSEWIERNGEIFRSIRSALGRDGTEGAITDVLDGALDRYVQGRADAIGAVLSESDLRLITSVCRGAILGLLFGGARQGMRPDPRETVSRLEPLFDSAITEAIRNASSRAES